jgi:hypothetical protein
MDLAFDDMYSLVLGLNRGQGEFFNFLGAPMILYNAKHVFLAVNASLPWLYNVNCLFLSFQLITSGG